VEGWRGERVGGRGQEEVRSRVLMNAVFDPVNKLRNVNLLVMETDRIDPVFAKFELNNFIDGIPDGIVIPDD